LVDDGANSPPICAISTLRRGATLSIPQLSRVADKGSYMMFKAIPAAAALAVAAVLVVPTVSHAQDTRSMAVSYADLNLASAKGQDRLQRRVNLAASYVCGQADTRDFNWAREVELCRTGALEGAQPAILAAINNARHPSVEVLQATSLVVTAK
jgi:UrcA family protein